MTEVLSPAEQSDRSIDGQFQVGSRITLTIAGLTSAFSAGCLCLLLFLNRESSGRLTREDGIVENISAAAFLASAGVCAFVLSTRTSRHRFYLMLWLFLSVIFFGEEISWGQRVIDYSTPEFLSSNFQNEANFHNLPFWTPKVIRGPSDLLTSQGLFYLGFFTYFCVLPFLQRLGPFQKILDRVSFPTTPIVLLIFLWIPILLSFGLASGISYGPLRDAIAETREMCFALAVLSYILCLAFSEPVPVGR
ncbi:MAG: hypothetical protein ACR2NU_03610 [Aeoliella sp.]